MQQSRTEIEYPRLSVRSGGACKMLGISKPTLLQWAKREDFDAAFTIGGCTLYSVDKLREWVNKQAERGGDSR